MKFQGIALAVALGATLPTNTHQTPDTDYVDILHVASSRKLQGETFAPSPGIIRMNVGYEGNASNIYGVEWEGHSKYLKSNGTVLIFDSSTHIIGAGNETLRDGEEVYHTQLTGPDLRFSIPRGPGKHAVTLLFSDISGPVGSFNVTLQNHTEVSFLDVYTEAVADEIKVYKLESEVTVLQGEEEYLEVRLAGVGGDAFLSGLVVNSTAFTDETFFEETNPPPLPSVRPSGTPSVKPSKHPSPHPSQGPSDRPSGAPSSQSPTVPPIAGPTQAPTPPEWSIEYQGPWNGTMTTTGSVEPVYDIIMKFGLINQKSSNYDNENFQVKFYPRGICEDLFAVDDLFYDDPLFRQDSSEYSDLIGFNVSVVDDISGEGYMNTLEVKLNLRELISALGEGEPFCLGVDQAKTKAFSLVQVGFLPFFPEYVMKVPDTTP